MRCARYQGLQVREEASVIALLLEVQNRFVQDNQRPMQIQQLLRSKV